MRGQLYTTIAARKRRTIFLYVTEKKTSYGCVLTNNAETLKLN